MTLTVLHRHLRTNSVETGEQMVWNLTQVLNMERGK